MEASAAARVLVVAHRTAATPALLDAVSERAEQGPAVFTAARARTRRAACTGSSTPRDTDGSDAQMVLELAIPLLERVAGGPVEGKIGDHNAYDAVSDAVNLDRLRRDHIISTLPAHVSRWLRIDLPHKLNALGLPVTTVTASGAPARAAAAAGDLLTQPRAQPSRSRSACSVDQNASSSQGSSSGAKRAHFERLPSSRARGRARAPRRRRAPLPLLPPASRRADESPTSISISSSSRASRRAASGTDSPRSTKPPGNVQRPAPSCSARRRSQMLPSASRGCRRDRSGLKIAL